MNAWLIWLAAFASGASLAHLIHSDTLTDPLRTRWRNHFLAKTDAVLNEADSLLQIARGSTKPADMGKLRQEIHNRAQEEPGVSFFATGKERRAKRPWSAMLEKMDRIEGYADFLGCRWCLPPWVYLVVVVWTWGRVFGFSLDVTQAVPVPVDYLLIAAVLAFRWVYGIVDTKTDQVH